MRNRKGFTLFEFIFVIAIIAILTSPISWCVMGGCGSSKTICLNGNEDCHEFQQVGLLSGEKNPKIEYEVNVVNVVFGTICVYSLFAPALAFGWWLYEPVGLKDPEKVQGT